MEHPSPTTPTNPSNSPFNTTNFNTATSNNSTTFSTRRAALNPAFSAKLAQMSLRLAPLVQLTTGQIHPSFPRSLLAFWLLTDAELDSLARFYHQRTPCQWTAHYPCPVTWPQGMGIEEKRRKLGKFIGLRGCDTPVAEIVGSRVAREMGKREDEVEGDARRERGAGDEVEEVRRKMGWY